jgi:hypothetical protein
MWERRMRPIEQLTDQTFNEVLKAVSFRLPRGTELKPGALHLALGLRYGLLGAAAAHHLLLSCPDRDEQRLVSSLRNYGYLVEDHVRAYVAGRIPFSNEPGFPQRIGSLAREPLVSYMPLYRRLCPLELCLSVVCDEFALLHRSEICSGVGLFGKRFVTKEFQKLADQSYVYALHFFERRQAGLEEVKEIALLGE